ncbi:MAG: phosphoribosylanthranilate isomerase [Methyloceanibacter sp.]|nr:phosphoribosylanthranilate isomerase [Methyloceanibacter sp.]
MPVKVKICGVRTPAIVETTAEEGADFIGLVLFPKSPRYVELEEARVLVAIARGKIGTVAVLVDPDDALIDAVVERVRPDLLQLHGSETPERVAAIRTRTGLPVMKAVSVANAGDVANAAAYAGRADYILFDAKPTQAANLPGGNGVPFDWLALKALTAPFALSGGLNPDTVGEAIRVTGASLVDVSSGVERAPGEKDAELVRRFIRAAKSAAPQARAKAS